MCPVGAIMAYIALRGKEDGLFFRFQSGQMLTKHRFVSEVRKCISEAGINAKAYSGHSFRIGAATMAGRKGLSPEKIQTLGRQESSAYLL